jgi:ATP-dependent Lhr-like helicase
MNSRLHPKLMQHIIEKHWQGLTEIQLKAFDAIYDGENCIIEAPTSGGKTEAVFFPLLSRVSQQKKQGIRILYIAPLKALLNDIEGRAIEYAEVCSLRVFKWHGDVSQASKIKQIKLPDEVLLTTPESLEAILLRKANWTEMFQNIESIVIDEAHAFALSDRGSHLVSLLERISSAFRQIPQRIAITATIGNPEKMLVWITGSSKNSGKTIKVIAQEQKEKDFKVSFFEDGEESRLNQVLYSVLSGKRSIVFENSRSLTEARARFINELNDRNRGRLSVNIRTHHSSVSKYYREDAERMIKMKGETGLNAIISTSTLELGIDIGELNQVVQIGDLASSGSFLQRVGRTGRRLGVPQFFRGFVTNLDDLILQIASVSLGIRGLSEEILFPKMAFHILAHQIICFALQKAGSDAHRMWGVLKGVSCFARISELQFSKLVDYMVGQDYLRRVDHGIIVTSDRTEREFLSSNWKRLFAVFDSGPTYQAVDGKTIVGTLDSAFVRAQDFPFLVMLGGIEWITTKVNHEAQQVSVKRYSSGSIPKWKVFRSSDVPFEISQEIGRILIRKVIPDFLDASAKMGLEKWIALYERVPWEEDKWILQAHSPYSATLWTFAGDRVNRLLKELLVADDQLKASEDYLRIEIHAKPAKKGQVQLSLPSARLLGERIERPTATDIETRLLKKLKAIPFSKFSSCLPENQCKLALIEKAFDVERTLRLVESVELIYDDKK